MNELMSTQETLLLELMENGLVNMTLSSSFIQLNSSSIPLSISLPVCVCLSELCLSHCLYCDLYLSHCLNFISVTQCSFSLSLSLSLPLTVPHVISLSIPPAPFPPLLNWSEKLRPASEQVYCIFLFCCAASLFGTLISQVNEIVAAQAIQSKELDSILESYLTVKPRYIISILLLQEEKTYENLSKLMMWSFILFYLIYYDACCWFCISLRFSEILWFSVNLVAH